MAEEYFAFLFVCNLLVLQFAKRSSIKQLAVFVIVTGIVKKKFVIGIVIFDCVLVKTVKNMWVHIFLVEMAL